MSLDISKRNKVSSFGFHLLTPDYSVFDPFYGPWNSWTEMANTLNGVDDFTQDEVEDFKESLGVGVTVGIYKGGKVVEYWKPGNVTENGGFIEKQPDVEFDDSDIAEAVSDYFVKNPPLTESDVNNIVEGKNYIERSEANKTYITYQQIAEYATKDDVKKEIANASLGDDSDFDFEVIKDYIDEQGYATKNYVDGEIEKVNSSTIQYGSYIDDSDSDPYNDDYVEGAVKFSDFVERERVIAEALNDLNDRIKDTDVSKLSKEIKEVAEVSSSSIISLDTRIDQLEETLVKSVDKDGAGLLFYLVA